jgi:hypothetical protein
VLVSTMYFQSDLNVEQADVQRGFRLHVTNLEDRALTYLVVFCVTPPTPEALWASPLTQLLGVAVGGIGSYAPFHRSGSIYVASVRFPIEPGHTVAVTMFPSGSQDESRRLSWLEGYATIELPVLRGESGERTFFARPQADRPMKVLLNPETTMIHRARPGPGYMLDKEGFVTGRIPVARLNFDTVEPLVPASGKAENELMPNGVQFLSHEALVEAMQPRLAAEDDAAPIAHASAADRMRQLITLLGELGTEDALIHGINDVLARNRATARLSLLGR